MEAAVRLSLIHIWSRFSIAETADGVVTKVIFANMGIDEQKRKELEEEAENKKSPVSYTHLDVYKRQPYRSCAAGTDCILPGEPGTGRHAHDIPMGGYPLLAVADAQNLSLIHI